jgi:nucleotide-binding universal stress UspA family protein
MKTIIVPVDFTPASNNAANYAADLALALGAEIHLIHVLNIPDYPMEVPIPDYALDELRDNALNSLAALAAELSLQCGSKISVATDLETGDCQRRVKDFCRWKNAFLIVRNSSGHATFQSLPYPQLIIPEHSRFQPIHHIALALDEKDLDPGLPIPLPFIENLRSTLQASFDILHISTDVENNNKANALAIEKWHDLPQDPYHQIQKIDAPSIEEGIRKYMDQHPIDWLMVFPKKRGLFRQQKSLSEKIILECPVPILSIHQ